ncbi:hypothetical protein CR157_17130 [Halomonas sp. LBP4]|nr:hypothetical protein CR157_17130 [Halomonas sp. LBP4]
MVVSVVGARGVSFGDCIDPQTFPSPWARGEDEDEMDDEEGPDDMTPAPGATCENHPDQPAVIDVEYGPLCEDCAEHYLSGFIRE